MIEAWKDIPRWNGLYQVSNLGRVKRIERTIKGKGSVNRILPEGIIQPINGKNGHLYIRVIINNKAHRDSINRLVSELFPVKENQCVPYNQIKKNKLTRYKKAEIVEAWVNNPNLNFQSLTNRFGIDGSRISALISNIWFFKQETVSTERITLPSSMDDEIELGKTA